jgi:hypothetical protein
MVNEVLTTKESMGVAKQIKIEYPKSNMTTSIKLYINNRVQGDFTFDKLKNKSEIMVDYYRDIMARDIFIRKQKKLSTINNDYKTNWKYEFLEFNLKQKGRFQFY